MRASSSRRAVVSVQARQAEAGVGVFATKAGMMTYFTADGLAVPATVLAMESSNYVTGVKTQATDGYDAVQVGYKEVPERKVRKPELGHLKKAGCPPLKHLREFKVRRRSARRCRRRRCFCRAIPHRIACPIRQPHRSNSLLDCDSTRPQSSGAG